jgi:hypothetical protein
MEMAFAPRQRKGMIMSTNTKANVELERRPLEDHELEIVRGGLSVLSLQPTDPIRLAPTDPIRFTPTDPVRVFSGDPVRFARRDATGFAASLI